MSRNPTEQPLAEGDEGLDFHHPYTPYDVQLRFMKTVYDTLERGDGQVGILESPTGTVGPRTYSLFAFPHEASRRKYSVESYLDSCLGTSNL